MDRQGWTFCGIALAVALCLIGIAQYAESHPRVKDGAEPAAFRDIQARWS
jgi:hypothetical protein